MKRVFCECAAIGEVLSYSKGWNFLSNVAYVIVNVNDERIVVSIDARQQSFIRKEYPPGSQIPVGFYGGKWHIESKPAKEEKFTVPEAGVSINEVIENLEGNEVSRT
jgi:hypothetical protein